MFHISSTLNFRSFATFSTSSYCVIIKNPGIWKSLEKFLKIVLGVLRWVFVSQFSRHPRQGATLSWYYWGNCLWIYQSMIHHSSLDAWTEFEDSEILSASLPSKGVHSVAVLLWTSSENIAVTTLNLHQCCNGYLARSNYFLILWESCSLVSRPAIRNKIFEMDRTDT